MAQHYSEFQFLDFSDERSTMKIFNGAITVGTIAGFLTQFGTLRTAVDAITRGTISKEKWVGDDTLLSNARPADANAHREVKWLVRYRDSVTQKKYQFTIPTADPTGRLVAGTDLADMTNAEIIAFRDAFVAMGRSPDNDVNAVVVDAIQYVGRNI